MNIHAGVTNATKNNTEMIKYEITRTYNLRLNNYSYRNSQCCLPAIRRGFVIVMIDNLTSAGVRTSSQGGHKKF